MPRMSIKFDYEWVSVKNRPNESYYFPQRRNSYMSDHYKIPAIYRWVICKEITDPPNLKWVYVGQAEELYRRLGNYLNAHPSQQTNYRSKKDFLDCISLGYLVTLEILEFSYIKTNDSVFPCLDSSFFNVNMPTKRFK